MLLAIHILRDAVTHFSTLSSFENYITLLRGTATGRRCCSCWRAPR
ncbi:MAG: hypothetical protein ACLR8Y_07160 [Alistipes indistinctus]